MINTAEQKKLGVNIFHIFENKIQNTHKKRRKRRKKGEKGEKKEKKEKKTQQL